MGQTTLDDELFDEAAAEVQADVEDHLERARDAFPAVEDIWEVEAENTLGVLNALRGALDIDDINRHLRDAKKWYAMGERAGAFDESDDLEAQIEELEAIVPDLTTARSAVDELTTTLPELKTTLEGMDDEGTE